MSYTLTSVTIRTDNTPEGMKKIGELWDDVTGGKLPILFDSAHNFQTGISPVSRYRLLRPLCHGCDSRLLPAHGTSGQRRRVPQI